MQLSGNNFPVSVKRQDMFLPFVVCRKGKVPRSGGISYRTCLAGQRGMWWRRNEGVLMGDRVTNVTIFPARIVNCHGHIFVSTNSSSGCFVFDQVKG